jgi:hypothetical protein
LQQSEEVVWRKAREGVIPALRRGSRCRPTIPLARVAGLFLPVED